MVESVEHNVLPYLPNLGTPSRLFVQYKGLLYQTMYRYNQADDSLMLEMIDTTTGTIVVSTKVVKNGSYFARDAYGYPVFVLFFKDDNPYNPVIWIFDEAQLEAAAL